MINYMKEKLIEILKDTFELESVDINCSQENCPQWDSMNHLNLVLELEEEFDLAFTPEEIKKMKSFNAIVDVIMSKQND